MTGKMVLIDSDYTSDRNWHTQEVEAKFLLVRFVPISERCLARLSVFPCVTKADIVTITTDG